jgi:hypothetical protein
MVRTLKFKKKFITSKHFKYHVPALNLGFQIRNLIFPNQILTLKGLNRENINVPNVGGHALRCFIKEGGIINIIFAKHQHQFFVFYTITHLFSCHISTSSSNL